MIPGSQEGRRDSATRKEEKPGEACSFTVVGVGARALILPGPLRIAQVKHATPGIYLSPSSWPHSLEMGPGTYHCLQRSWLFLCTGLAGPSASEKVLEERTGVTHGLDLRWKESEATQNYPPTTAVAAVKVGQGEAIQGLVIYHIFPSSEPLLIALSSLSTYLQCGGHTLWKKSLYRRGVE